MDSLDLLSVGKATLDIFLWTEEANRHFRLNPDTNELCIRAGDKAEVDRSFFLTGGNANNVAIGISRMNFKAGIMAEIGVDEFAQKIKNVLTLEKVSDKFLKQTPNQTTSFSVILNFKGDRTILEENIDREHDFSFDNINAKWIYLTSMEKKWEEAYKRTLDYVKQKGVKLALNPGTTQLDANTSILDEAIAKSDIIFLNKEEAARICGIESSNDDSLIPHLLSSVKNKGVGTVIITDGSKGAHMLDSKGQVYFNEPSPAEIIERTGAGDAFASGFLGGIMSGLPENEAMKWGSRNAASVIGKIGAQEGLLKREELANN